MNSHDDQNDTNNNSNVNLDTATDIKVEECISDMMSGSNRDILNIVHEDKLRETVEFWFLWRISD